MTSGLVEASAMRTPRVRFTVRQLMGAVALVAAILGGVLVLGPSIYLTITAAVLMPGLALKAWPHLRRWGPYLEDAIPALRLPRISARQYLIAAFATATLAPVLYVMSLITGDASEKTGDERWLNATPAER